MDIRPHALLVSLTLALLAFATGCSTPGPAADPLEEAFSESREAVLTGVEEGFEESEGVDEYAVTTRLNPCRCEAPDHEIYIHGRWTRVYLEGEREVLAEVDEHLDGEPSTLAAVELRGSLSGDETSSRGVEFPVFEVSELAARKRD